MKKDNNQAEVSPELQRAINAIILQAKEAGIPSFVLAFKDKEGKPTLHFENISYADAINLMSFGFVQGIRMDMAAHPEYVPQFTKIFEDFVRKYLLSLKDLNEEVKKYKQK